MSEVISSFKSLRAGSQVFALLMLFICVILHTMWSGKSLQLLCILPCGMLCLSAISMMFVKMLFEVCIIIIIIIFIRINNYTYRVHIKHLSTNYIKIFRIENKLYYNNYFYKIIVIQYNI